MRRPVMVFVGTRPEAIKLAPVIRRLCESQVLAPRVVVTGQHQHLVAPVLTLFNITVHHLLDRDTEGGLANLLGWLMNRIDTAIESDAPAFALVQGDTSTALAAALACSYRRVPIGHVEAGLRTGNPHSPFPEEVHRRAIATLSTLHFAPTPGASANLEAEGIGRDSILITGNTGVDALLTEATAQRTQPDRVSRVDISLDRALGAGWRERPLILVTVHRRESFGRPLEQICAAIRTLAREYCGCRFVLPVHPNPSVASQVRSSLSDEANVLLTSPLNYDEFVRLLGLACLVITDSGGIQEEAPALGKHVIVMRATTERPEAVDAGASTLVGTTTQSILEAVRASLGDPVQVQAKSQRPLFLFGDGSASDRIVKAIEHYSIAGRTLV